ncbi:MAG: hypothetical protein MOB07_24300 [Acidobacteria bacterium]|nr:hypothetical protein [Acidobacteriota bacterium]
MTEKLSIEAGRKILRDQASEAEIQSAILEYLTVQRIPHSITNATMSLNVNGQIVRRITPGWPDITCCLPPGGELIALECKRAVGGVLTYNQASCLHLLWKAGAMVIIARSLDDVISTLSSRKTSTSTLDEISMTLCNGPSLKKPHRVPRQGRAGSYRR